MHAAVSIPVSCLLGVLAGAAWSLPPLAAQAPPASIEALPGSADPTQRALEAELSALGLAPACESAPDGTFRCRYRARAAAGARSATALATHDPQTATVYVHVPHVLQAPAGAPATPTLLQRLMELNWEMLIGKFEWDARTGEVRLSAVLNTDSNFDRRALRSVVAALDTCLARYGPQLRALSNTLTP